MSIEAINQADVKAASHLFRQCCTSETWIARMIGNRPYRSAEDLRTAADESWKNLADKDYLQAFDGHPKIGDVGSLKAKYANTKELAAGEQSAVNEANEQTIMALANGNSAYEKKFGFIFIVCATGKSAAEMLALLEARMPNTREQELMNAAQQQRKIFHLRLEKLL
jgi:2-oxo-4-hydroxy-4-carboxy-5-ureidoimidazoline decarboxylase